jgi:hypothetical protein
MTALDQLPRQVGSNIAPPLIACVISPVTGSSNGMRSVAGHAVIDTGSAITIVDAAVMTELGIEPSGTWGALGLGVAERTRLEAPVYAARLEFPGSILEPLTLRDLPGLAVEWESSPGKRIIALLGRAALVNVVMIYDGVDGSITLLPRP